MTDAATLLPDDPETNRPAVARLHAILDGIPFGVVTLATASDGALRIRRINAAAARTLGVDPAPLIGRALEEAFPRIAGTDVPARLRRTARLGEPLATMELAYDGTPDGGVVEITAFSSAPGEAAVFVRDVTNRRRAEQRVAQSEQQWRRLFEHSGDAILIARRGRYVAANKRAHELFRAGSAAIVDLPIGALSPGAFDVTRVQVEEALGIARAQGWFETERVFRRFDGTIFPGEGTITLIDEEEDSFQLSVRDISERREAERLRSQATAELERQVSLRTAELRHALADLEATQETLIRREKLASLGDLVAGVAHEINTPVGIGVTAVTHLQAQIATLARALAEGTLGRRQLEQGLAEATRSLEITHANLARAADLVRSFKQISVDQTSQAVRAIALGDWLRSLLVSLEPTTKRARLSVSLSVEPDGEVVTDPGALAQVITNLVSNAAIHAFEGRDDRRVALEAAIGARTLEIRFRDNGVGMEPAVAARIFDPFFTTARARGGTGLGLHILHNLVTARLGGDVSVESVPGAGTTFVLTLPFRGAEA
ncbi:PAS domain-containing sensor histidine kinase [Salinarimonas rosea]|uniref:PAS domain-containing sensor histidine kinase n=1 Tax=Salinarimonas rosea TaxID=552063 RepID=UPI00042678A1|nr:ATP-binding protein [Salinarimonas rosea]